MIKKCYRCRFAMTANEQVLLQLENLKNLRRQLKLNKVRVLKLKIKSQIANVQPELKYKKDVTRPDKS